MKPAKGHASLDVVQNWIWNNKKSITGRKYEYKKGKRN